MKLSVTFAAGSLAVLMSSAGAYAASVTGTVDRTSQFAIAYTSSDLQYTSGDSFSDLLVALICMDETTHEPNDGSVQSYSIDTIGAVFKSGAGEAGFAALNWLVDTFYADYFLSGTDAQQWAFQYSLWEIGNDYTGDVSSISAYADNSRPADDPYGLAGFTTAYETIYAGLEQSLGDLDDSYRSSTYTITALLNGDGVYQNMLAITAEAPEVAPVPLPAAAPLLIAGLGALGFAARRRKSA